MHVLSWSDLVKKGRELGVRRIGCPNRTPNAATVELARRLAASSEPAPRWVGKDALNELTSEAVLRRLHG